MIKRLAVLAAGAVLSLLTPAASRAAEGAYAGFELIGSVAQTRDARNEGSLGGDTTNPNDSDLVGGFGGLLGYEWKLPGGLLGGALRSELELHYRVRYDFDRNRPVIDNAFPNAGLDSNLSSATGLANLYYLPELNSSFRPYLGGGLGGTLYDAPSEFNDLGGLGLIRDQSSGLNLTWAAAGGVIWEWDARTDFVIGYRYIDLGTIEFGRFVDGGIEVEADYTSHDLVLGVLYKF
jgi:opacity protein-like surface antigen